MTTQLTHVATSRASIATLTYQLEDAVRAQTLAPCEAHEQAQKDARRALWRYVAFACPALSEETREDAPAC